MKPAQAVCNYAILRFRPYAETEEFVNVGVLVMCQQPCLLHFEAEPRMPDRAKALFPKQNEHAFAAALEAMTLEMERLKAGACDQKSVQRAFHETVRIRESVFRFGEVRTILTAKPQQLADDLFARYVRMEATVESEAGLVTA
jgi:Protein of unknown function (DUF3037)